MAELIQRFIDIAPRESSGSRSANRFDYQDDWALCRLLELHEKREDYVVIFDYHDDVVVLDSASDPQSVLFYQVKTKRSGTWRTSDLVRQPKGKSGPLPSIIGKLYSNYENFPDETSGLHLVSNASFNIKLDRGGTATGETFVRFDALAEADRQKFTEAIQNELGKPDSADGVRLLVYQTSDLSLNGHVDHSLGKLTSFLDHLPDTTTEGAAAFYRTLKGEISRRAKSEQSVTTAADLCQYRAISRQQFENMLTELRLARPSARVVDGLRERLNSERAPYRQVVQIVDSARKFIAERFDPTNRMLDEAQRVVSNEIQGGEHEQLYDAIKAHLPSCRDALAANGMDYADDYIRAMIGVRLSETQELQNADTDAEEKTA